MLEIQNPPKQQKRNVDDDQGDANALNDEPNIEGVDEDSQAYTLEERTHGWANNPAGNFDDSQIPDDGQIPADSQLPWPA